MRFEWDNAKDKVNRAKHGVSFETARRVFDDPRALSVQDPYEGGEERWRTLGVVDGLVIILVAHTVADESEVIRIISARKATKMERHYYEQGF